MLRPLNDEQVRGVLGEEVALLHQVRERQRVGDELGGRSLMLA
jgi:hypothetical protein